MTGTWKMDGSIDPISATDTEVQFGAISTEGNHTVSLNGNNVLTISVEGDQ